MAGLRTILGASLIAATLVTPVQGAILQVTVYGLITDSVDSDGTFFGHGAGYDTLAGLAIVQTFRYDTDAPVVNVGNGDPRVAEYIVPGANGTLDSSWISVETVIDGVALQIPVEVPQPQYQGIADGIDIIDKWDESASLVFRDYFGVSVSASSRVSLDEDNTLHHNLTTAATAQTYFDIVQGIGLSQAFDLDRALVSFSGGGYLSGGFVTLDGSGNQVSMSSGHLNYVAHRYVVAPVPVPAAGWLLGGALAVMAGLRRKRHP